MKQYCYTANGTQRSKCGKKGSPKRVKNVDDYKKILLEKFFQQCQDKLLTLLK